MISTLLTFAVKEESLPFQKLTGPLPDLRVLLTGIGQRNASRAIHRAFAERSPDLVLTCGFAGGLNPALTLGTVVFSADDGFPLAQAALAAGARPTTFYCAERVAVTVKEKKALWQSTGADAVEMESGAIRAMCLERKIPSATVRVISDVAQEDLPLDFNSLLDAEQNFNYAKLGLALLKSPGKAAALRQLQKQTQAAAVRLAEVLAKVLPLHAKQVNAG